ncbi:MAG: DegV family protein [Anaerolineaceae bacterium]|nr:DegV family protein [Anaerolineaceae bacterium]
MPSEIELITDSTCDIPAELIDQYGVTVLSHTLIWGEEQYRDRVEIQPEEFYQRLGTDSRLPKTSQISVYDFLTAFEAARLRGVKEVLAITLSSALSGAYQSAVTAAEQCSLPVHIVDSKSVTMGLGWQVLAAARALTSGATVRSALEVVEAIRQKLQVFVCMDTLKYLSTGGRIGNAGKWIGTLLDIKPVVWINHVTGVVEPLTVARTSKRAVEVFYQKFFDKLEAGSKPLRIAVTHGGVPEEGQRLAERIREDHDPVEILINTTGPVLGVNTGPGALALAGYLEE